MIVLHIRWWKRTLVEVSCDRSLLGACALATVLAATAATGIWNARNPYCIIAVRKTNTYNTKTSELRTSHQYKDFAQLMNISQGRLVSSRWASKSTSQGTEVSDTGLNFFYLLWILKLCIHLTHFFEISRYTLKFTLTSWHRNAFRISGPLWGIPAITSGFFYKGPLMRRCGVLFMFPLVSIICRTNGRGRYGQKVGRNNSFNSNSPLQHLHPDLQLHEVHLHPGPQLQDPVCAQPQSPVRE